VDRVSAVLAAALVSLAAMELMIMPPICNKTVAARRPVPDPRCFPFL